MRGVLLTFLLLAAPPAFAQADGQPPAAPASSSPPATAVVPSAGNAELPVSLVRIREGLVRPDLLRTQFGDDGRVVFRVEVEGRLPTFQAFIGEDTPLTGPTPFGSMTHSDFLDLVNPPLMRSFGSFTNTELLQVLATSLVSGAIVNGAAEAIKGVRGVLRDRRTRLAQEEVRQVIAEVERRKREAEQRKADDSAPPREGASPKAPEGR
jgi:hypothetical protein